MKKLSLIIVAALLFTWPALSFGKVRAGKFLAVKRKVYLLREGDRKDARPSMPFLLMDEVETGEKSRAKLLFRDDSVYSLGERSRLSVKKYLYDSERARSNAVVTLIKGMMKVGVGRSDLEIHTPTAVVAARGTSLLLWVEGEGEEAVTYIHVLEGEVSVRNLFDGIKGVVILRKGKGAKVPSRRPPSEMKRDLKGDIIKIRRATIVPFIDRDGFKRFVFHLRGTERLPLRKRLIRRYIRRRIIAEQPISQEPAGAFTPVTINIEFPGVQ
jgi:hypothetical protein